MRPIWSKQIKPQPQPLRPLFEAAAAEGFDMVEWRSPTSYGVTVPGTDLVADPGSAGEIRDLSAAFGVEMAYHAPQGPLWDFGMLPFETAVSRLRESVVRASSIGARMMTFHLGIADGEQRVGAIRRGAGVVRGVLSFAEDLGVALCVENVFDACSVATVEEVEMLFEEADDSRLRFTFDTGHAYLCECLYEMAGAFPEQLAFTHVHDNDGCKDQHRVPGRGAIDWRRLVSCLDGAGYTGPLNFELREDVTLPELIRIWDVYRGGRDR